MLRELINLATRLDKKGFAKEADMVDSVINKLAVRLEGPGGEGFGSEMRIGPDAPLNLKENYPELEGTSPIDDIERRLSDVEDDVAELTLEQSGEGEDPIVVLEDDMDEL